MHANNSINLIHWNTSMPNLYAKVKDGTELTYDFCGQKLQEIANIVSIFMY